MITTEMIKKLREKTGTGIMICKKILNETNGDMDKALEILKEMEVALAAKKAERATSEGLIGVYVSEDKKTGAMVELNCETDFVASNKDFVALTNSIAQHIAATSAQGIESLMQKRYIEDASLSVNDAITRFVAKFGENISLSRFIRLSTKTGMIRSYVHNGSKIGTLVELVCKKTDQALEVTAKEVALQVAATNPLFLNRDSADQGAIEQERQSYKNQALSEGRPAHVIDKIVMGKLDKYYKKNCLIEQSWIKNEDMTIADFLKESSEKLGAGIEIVRFARFERGKS
jgi:elongation factor Ts